MRRDNNKRFYLITYTAVMLSFYLPFFGESAIGYNYCRTRYKWELEEYSDYKSICSIMDLVGQAVLIPILGLMQLPDANIIPFIIFTVILRHTIKGYDHITCYSINFIMKILLRLCSSVLDDVLWFSGGSSGSLLILSNQIYCDKMC